MFRLPTLLITGADGQLGYETAALAQEEGFDVLALSRAALDISSPAAVAEALVKYRPGYVINAAAAFDDSLLAVNHAAAGTLAAACAEANVILLHPSCAEVFDGLDEEPYSEEFQPAPISAYGRSKAAGEELVRHHQPRHVIVRTGWLFSARGHSVVRRLLESARSERVVEASEVLVGSPTAAADLARVILAIIKQLDTGCEAWGTYHYTGAEAVSWFGFCEAVIAAARQYEELQLEMLLPSRAASADGRAQPLNSQLDCTRIRNAFGIHQRTWRSGLMQAIRSLHA